MNLKNLRQRINESYLGIRVNDSNAGLRFEGVHRAQTLDEFLDGVGNSRVAAQIRIRESCAVDSYSARLTSKNQDGRKMIYDEESDKFRHYFIPGKNHRRRAIARTKHKIENALEEIRIQRPDIQTEFREDKNVQLQGLSFENRLTLGNYATGLVFQYAATQMLHVDTEVSALWAMNFLIVAAGCFVAGTTPYFNRAVVWFDKRSDFPILKKYW